VSVAERASRTGTSLRAPRPARGGLTALAPAVPGAALTLLIGGALAGIMFGAGGGLRIEANTIVEIAVCLAGAVLVAMALVLAPAGRVWGAGSVTLMAGLAALTAASLVWAVEPSDAWESASLILAYLAILAGAVSLVRLVPARWEAVLGGVALATLAVCVYALLTKVFPAALDPDETYARLEAPYGYWNAVGLTAALAVPSLLWLGARRTGHGVLNSLAFPALGVVLVTMMLSYSRGALLALAFGLAVWFATVPLRLRGLAVLLTAVACAAPVVAWAFSRDDLTSNNVAIAQRTSAGHTLGLLVVAMVVVLLLAGLTIGFAAARRPPSPRTRRRAGIAALVALALAPVVLVAVLAVSSRGLTGQVSHGWHSLTSADARTPPNDPSRLTATASVRARYWREALKVFGDHPWLGAGAGAYATTRNRYRHDTLVVRHAHGYVVQTLADLGIAGLAVSLALLAVWLAAALRATGLRRRDRGRPFSPERVGLLTLLSVVVVFGVHSLIDWTWFVPGTAAVGLLAAGWLAGRGPLFASETDPASALVRPRLAQWRALAPRAAGGLAVVVVALAAAWAILQPLRSVNAGNDALQELSQGRSAAALATARTAHDRNPLSVDPLFDEAVIQDAAGHRQAALAALVRAVSLQPANPATWERLADYQLNSAGRPRDALQATRVALFLDPRSAKAQSDFLMALRALAAQSAPAPAPAP
jgi:tetratricopeptide (TPR) repeat protein